MDRHRARRRTCRRGAVGRAARPRCARPPTLGLAAQARLGSGPCDLVWCDRGRRRPRAVGGRFQQRGKIRKHGARFVARRRDRRGARALAQWTRQHRRATAPQPSGGIPARGLRRVLDRLAVAALAVGGARARGPLSVDAQLERFSRAIPLVIVLLVASGLRLAFVQLDRIAALWTTSYGQLLACKLAGVVVLLALAAANRYRLVPKFETSAAAAARPLATAIAFELAIALLILSLVALWRFTPPPRALAVAAPISLHLHGEKAMAEIEIERNGE